MGPEIAKVMKQSPLYQLYPAAEWAVLFTKLGDLLRQDYDWSKDVAAIKLPVMMVFADAEAVRTAPVMEFFAQLGGGRRDAGLDGSGRPMAWLAILPGVTHYDIHSFLALAASFRRSSTRLCRRKFDRKRKARTIGSSVKANIEKNRRTTRV